MKRKIIERLLIFFVGLPVLLALVVFLPWKNHLVLNLLLTSLSALGGVELAAMIDKSRALRPREAALLGLTGPLFITLHVSFALSLAVVEALFVVCALFLLILHILIRKSETTKIAPALARSAAVLLYPGVLLSAVVWLNRLPDASILVVLYLVMVLGNDSLAWAAGILFGRNNRGLVAVSPNKSAAGFIGGLLTSVLAGTAAVMLFPGVFASAVLPSPLGGALLGLFTGTAAILGDLAESAIKRTCAVKDSGFVVPGRGGVLDSLDSLALAAPVFYVFYTLLF